MKIHTVINVDAQTGEYAVYMLAKYRLCDGRLTRTFARISRYYNNLRMCKGYRWAHAVRSSTTRHYYRFPQSRGVYRFPYRSALVFRMQLDVEKIDKATRRFYHDSN